MSISWPCGRTEKGTDSGNPWVLLALSRTVWMMLCKFKNQVLNKNFFFHLFPQELVIIVHGVLSTQIHGKSKCCQA